MKITTKFAYTGLILSILGTHPALADTSKKSALNVTSLKSCELYDENSESPCITSVIETRYGRLVFASESANSYDGSQIFLNNIQKTFNGDFTPNSSKSATSPYVTSKIYHFKDSDVILLVTPPQGTTGIGGYFFLKVNSDQSIKSSNSLSFEIDYDFESSPIQKNDKIILDFGNNINGIREVATYENDHIKVQKIVNEQLVRKAKEKQCAGTYRDIYKADNSSYSQIGRCQTQSMNDMELSVLRGNYIINNNLIKVMRYTCQTNKTINYTTFKKYVCDNKSSNK